MGAGKAMQTAAVGSACLLYTSANGRVAMGLHGYRVGIGEYGRMGRIDMPPPFLGWTPRSQEAVSYTHLLLYTSMNQNAPPKELQLKRCLSSKTRNWSFRQRIYFHLPQRDSAT